MIITRLAEKVRSVLQVFTKYSTDTLLFARSSQEGFVHVAKNARCWIGLCWWLLPVDEEAFSRKTLVLTSDYDALRVFPLCRRT